MPLGNLPSRNALQPALQLPRKQLSTFAIVMIVVGVGLAALLGLILLIVAAGVFYAYSSTTEEPTPQDREVLVTAGDLPESLWTEAIDPVGEAVTKTRYIDKSADVEYEYEHTDPDVPLYMTCIVHDETSPADAKMLYATLRVSMLGAMRLTSGGDVQQVDRNELFRWGDHSQCGLLVSNGFTVGNYFFACQGKKVFCLLIAGVGTEDADELRELLRPRLEQLRQHSL